MQIRGDNSYYSTKYIQTSIIGQKKEIKAKGLKKWQENILFINYSTLWASAYSCTSACWGSFIVHSAYHKCFWECWGISVLRLAYHCTNKVTVVSLAAHTLLHLPKCFYIFLTLLVFFLWYLLKWPNYHGSYYNPTIMDHIVTQPVHFLVQLVFF